MLRRFQIPLALLALLWSVAVLRAHDEVPAHPSPASESDSPLELGKPLWSFLSPQSHHPCNALPLEAEIGSCDQDNPSWLRRAGDYCWDETCASAWHICHDFKNMYWSWRLGAVGLGVGVAAPLANTSADEDFQNWYRRHSHNSDTENLSECVKRFGDHWLMIPIMVGSEALGRVFEDTLVGDTLFTWGNRSWRAMLVGSPTVGILQVSLGASRPHEHNSRWHPFRDENAVAGHGFIGAVPFLTAAAMAREKDRPLLRWGCVAASFLTTWSRIHDDSHYLSQALLGWWIAYLAVDSVFHTDREDRRLLFTPLEYPDGVGAGVVIRY